MAAASEADTRANFIDPDLLAVGRGSQQVIREGRARLSRQGQAFTI